MDQVRFIRKNGRVIPIKKNEERVAKLSRAERTLVVAKAGAHLGFRVGSIYDLANTFINPVVVKGSHGQSVRSLQKRLIKKSLGRSARTIGSASLIGAAAGATLGLMSKNAKDQTSSQANSAREYMKKVDFPTITAAAFGGYLVHKKFKTKGLVTRLNKIRRKLKIKRSGLHVVKGPKKPQ